MQIPTGFQWPRSPRGHPHFWQRALSRRQFIGASAAATAGALTAPAWLPTLVQADANDPTPIPQTVAPGLPFHIQLPGAGDPASITNFKGVVGVAAGGGQGTGTNVITGKTERLLFDVDNRFMSGMYVGAGGQTYHATFAFV
jgi:hypothetical protein